MVNILKFHLSVLFPYWVQTDFFTSFNFTIPELANWLVGDADIIDGTTHDDCLLNIIIENAQDNVDILLPTLQFIEALLDNTNERILHNMIFRYIHNRGYYDSNAAMTLVRTWSDEEDEREKRDSTATGPMKSNTLKPNNILKVINR